MMKMMKLTSLGQHRKCYTVYCNVLKCSLAAVHTKGHLQLLLVLKYTMKQETSTHHVHIALQSAHIVQETAVNDLQFGQLLKENSICYSKWCYNVIAQLQCVNTE